MPDPALLERLIQARTPAEVLAAVAGSPPGDVQRAAIAALGWKGATTDSPLLRGLLRHAEQGLADLAEDSLWRIWLHGGSCRANADLARAIELIGGDHYHEALAALDALILLEPTFAEAHHQRGIVLFMMDRPSDAAVAFRRAVELNPDHFAALVSLGHAALHQGELHTAVHCYQRALELNPRLNTVRDVVESLEPLIGGRSELST